MSELIAKFSDNTIFIGLVGAAVTASLMYLCRALPGWLWLFLKFQLTVRVYVKGDEAVYEWISKWLSKHPYTGKARNLRLSEGFDSSDWALTPGEGEHLVWENGWPIWIHRGVNKKNESGGVAITYGKDKRNESYVLTTLGRSQKRLIDLINKASLAKDKKEQLEVKVFQSGWWAQMSSRSKRLLSSVFLPEEISSSIEKDAEWFFSNPEWFLQRGVPYRRGYLFYGLPGAGKTSLVTALASHFDRPIYYINLNSIADDNALMSAFLTADKNCILLMEDIDSVGITRERKPLPGWSNKSAEEGPKGQSAGVTLSGLLNAIDGAASAEGRLLIMTTNHPENLDSALLRPGRVDAKWEFGAMLHTEALKMINAFFPEGLDYAEEIVRSHDGLTAAEWQQLLMLNRDTPENLLKQTPRLVAL